MRCKSRQMLVIYARFYGLQNLPIERKTLGRFGLWSRGYIPNTRLICYSGFCAGEGLKLTGIGSGNGSLTHTVYLTGISADAPARSALGSFMLFNSYRACPWCIWPGEYIVESGKKAIYFRHAPKSLLGFVNCTPGDPRLKLSHRAFVQKGLEVEAAYQVSKAKVKF